MNSGKVSKKHWKARGLTGRREKRSAWGYTMQIGDKQVRVFDADWSYQDALDALRARQAAIAAGQDVPILKRAGGKGQVMTFGMVAIQYLDHKEKGGKRSMREDRRIVGKRLLPAFGAHTPIADITGPMIAQYERQRTGQVGASTVCNELSVMKHLLRLARRWGYVRDVPDIEMPRKPDPKDRYLETDEIARLLVACAESKNPYLLTIVTAALNTGMRKEELLGLEWERVNFSTFTITLYKTKSGKPRGIPINADLERALVALQPDPAKRRGRLFVKKDGRAWGQVRTAFEMALDRAGIKHFTFHDQRHTFASHFVMRGGSLQDLKEILGHSDLRLTLRYAHLSTQHLRASMERMEGLTSAPVSTHKSTQSAKIQPECVVSPCAPVAQVDRAAVS